MFTIEGSLKVRENPQKLLGLYGLSYERADGQGRDFLHPGRRLAVKALAWALRPKALSPDTMTIEEITSLDQAELFAHADTRQLKFSTRRPPDLISTLESQLEAGERLLGAHAELWDEQRVYLVASRGLLLSSVNFDPELGWQETSCSSAGYSRRLSYGLPIALGAVAIEYDEAAVPL